MLTLLLSYVVGPAAAVDVVADDPADEYVISGSVLLNGSYPGAAEAAGCADCHWRIIRICTSGSLDDRRGCEQLPYPCTGDRAEVWRADATALPPVGDPAWRYRGLMCLTEQPTPTSTVTALVPEVIRQRVPALLPGSRPTNITLTNLRTAFFSGQPSEVEPEPVTVAGSRVQLHLRPTWTWDFGHGPPLVTTSPGAPVRNSAVRHRFPSRGSYRVRVDCTWQATYEVNGISGFRADDIHQSRSFDLRVKEARRFLTNPRSTA